MKKCTRCLNPETVDTLTFDEEGVCSVCRQVEFKEEKIDWDDRRKQLDGLIDEYANKGLYDCIVPFSGGKDSVFQLWYIRRILKLKPLVVRFNHWGYRPKVEDNNTMVFKKLGVDVVEFQPNFHVVRELMLESFKRRGDFCWHCHTGIYAGVMHMAVRFQVPLLFWGESTAEYHSWYTFEEMEEVDEKRFNRLMNQGITADDMYEFLQGRVEMRDLWMFNYPKRKDLMKLKVRSICLGNYIKWDTKANVELIGKELDWFGHEVEGVPPEFHYEKVECTFQGMRDYSKFVKRGYGRTNHLMSIDIRNGRKTREEALRLEEQYDGKRPASMDWFLEILNMTEDEYYDYLRAHAVHPWEFDKDKVEDGPVPYDFDKWDRTDLSDVPLGPDGRNFAPGKATTDAGE
ncbi:MAG: N-acetyl sugar amidotransferase [Pseudomonadota bacterium]|jgi:N-acetyl sugar amidotransferase|uniref:N-acetyl sugar amidotransferase n=1 Tax=Pseudooceanicola nitratireducens TaxID=517719 RepID=A0A1I1Q9A2_9RHOB|nr:N-acetyl sugar amidotransferase [Pseudooceanicola nitratireducens]MEC7298992.1 N-acetyl sugar amidotransferase [Pseudomonadota bacterium]MBY6167616.1 N-acetyl sugar amidotransferase [Pseudooceanicola nitratireducens]MEC7794573.1 N-acetyl sugar amidotransferase [Pseudomonadota bacterium]MEC8668730.1 N-acetyl sugar amidotransferase [Pseudomonadota bacterium]SEJ73237.1 N-acetyl sugar amidotransferase [Pseudooceanicola nitratireducens]